MLNKIKLKIEQNLYEPSLFWFIFALFLLPFSLLYTAIVTFKKIFTKPRDLGVKIISVGNLTLGGSGKTPLVKAIYKDFCKQRKICIILRGYKRQSKGLVKVALNGEILCDNLISGDEAMEYALNMANVIVCEDRIQGIKEAKNLGFDLILLDDGFSKFHIKKFEILLRPNFAPKLPFTVPVAAYRYPPFFYKFANFIPKDDDIKFHTEILYPTKQMILVTAIAKPWRLKPFFTHTKRQYFFPDHYDFKRNEIQNLLLKHDATSILCTFKDYVKLKNFDIPLSIISLNLELSENFKTQIRNYLDI